MKDMPTPQDRKTRGFTQSATCICVARTLPQIRHLPCLDRQGDTLGQLTPERESEGTSAADLVHRVLPLRTPMSVQQDWPGIRQLFLQIAFDLGVYATWLNTSMCVLKLSSA